MQTFAIQLTADQIPQPGDVYARRRHRVTLTTTTTTPRPSTFANLPGTYEYATTGLASLPLSRGAPPPSPVPLEPARRHRDLRSRCVNGSISSRTRQYSPAARGVHTAGGVDTWGTTSCTTKRVSGAARRDVNERGTYLVLRAGCRRRNLIVLQLYKRVRPAQGGDVCAARTVHVRTSRYERCPHGR